MINKSLCAVIITTFFVTIVTLLFTTTPGNSHQFVEEFFPTSKLYVNASKVWHVYIHAFVFKRLQHKHVLRVSHMHILYQKLKRVTHHFALVSNKLFPLPESAFVANVKPFKVTQKLPSWWLCHKRSTTTHTVSDNGVSWAVLLFSRAVLMNVFLKRVFIPTQAIHNCSYGFVSFQDCVSADSLPKYCGIHSAALVYPKYQKLCTHFAAHRSMEYDVQLFFTLTDTVISSVSTYLFTSFQKARHYTISQLPSGDVGSVIVEGKGLIQAYHIVGDKAAGMRLSIPDKSTVGYRIYDGPGILSPLLQKRWQNGENLIFEAGTFQVTLLAYHRSTKSLHDSRESLQFSRHYVHQGQAGKTSIIRPDERQNLTLPADSCENPRICRIPISLALQFRQSAKFRLKFSVLSLMYIGLHTITCVHGGFYVNSYLGAEYASLCANSTQKTKRQIISKDALLVLSVISYKHYSSVSVHLQAEVTTCRVTHIDPCLLHSICSTPFCKFQDVRTTADLLFAPISGLDGQLILVFRIKRRCVVIQVKKSVETFSDFLSNFKSCRIVLLPDKAPLNHVVLHHKVQFNLMQSAWRREQLFVAANVKTFSLHSEGDYSHLHYKTDSLQSFKLYGYSGSRVWGCGTPWFTPAKGHMVCGRNQRKTTNGVITMSSLYHSHIRNKVVVDYEVFAGWSASWVELTVWMSQIPNNSCASLPSFSTTPQEFQTNAQGEFVFLKGFITQIHDTFYVRIEDKIPKSCNDSGIVFLHVFAGLDKSSKFLKWSTTKTVHSLKRGHEISLPTSDFFGGCRHNEEHQSCNMCQHLNILIIHERYISLRFILWTDKPFSYISFNSTVDWDKSQKLCVKRQAQLPTFLSKPELEYFLAFLKLKKEFPVVDAIYIGLHHINTSKVSQSFSK